MIGEVRFFQEFFDGEIVQEESERYKMFKIVLFSVFSALGLFFVFVGICNIAELVLLELGMIWNIYTGINRKLSLLLGVAVGFIYFFFAANFNVYANGLIYIAIYIPLQMVALTKDYSEGSHVQIKKKISDYNKILFFTFLVLLFIVFLLFDGAMGSRFIVFDALSATLLVCSAVLRNERYSEYYIFRISALISSILLWILIAVEYNYTGALLILFMYISYLIFDISELIYQTLNYKSQYIVEIEKYENAMNEKKISDKLEVYKKSKEMESENEITEEIIISKEIKNRKGESKIKKVQDKNENSKTRNIKKKKEDSEDLKEENKKVNTNTKRKSTNKETGTK